MDKNILQMSMTERFKYLNKKKKEKYNISYNWDEERYYCEIE